MKVMLTKKSMLAMTVFVFLIVIFAIQYYVVLSIKKEHAQKIMHEKIMQASQTVLQQLPMTKVMSHDEGDFNAPAVTDDPIHTKLLFQEQLLSLMKDSHLPLLKVMNTEMSFTDFEKGNASATIQIPVEIGLTTLVTENVVVPVPHTKITK